LFQLVLGPVSVTRPALDPQNTCLSAFLMKVNALTGCHVVVIVVAVVVVGLGLFVWLVNWQSTHCSPSKSVALNSAVL